MKNNLDSIIQNINQVHIDDEGKFKYILIKLSNGADKEHYFVRGLNKYEYHGQIFEHFYNEAKENVEWASLELDLEEGQIKAELNETQYEFKCLGGGRIVHSNKDQTLSIYGYSWLYGQCDHVTSLKVIRTLYQYPVENVSTSDQGY